MPTQITNHGADRRYATLIPNIIFACARDAYDLAFWATVKMIAGEENFCRLGTRDLAALAGMSVAKAADCRAYLLTIGAFKGYLEDNPHGQATWHLTIPDLWPANVAWRVYTGDSLFQRIADITTRRTAIRAGSVRVANALLAGHPKCSPDEQECSPDEQERSPGEQERSPGESKNNHQEEPEEKPEEKPGWAFWPEVVQHLRLRMTKGTWETWIKDLTATYDAEHRLVTITATSAYGRDWIALRLRGLIKRTIADFVGNNDFELFVTCP